MAGEELGDLGRCQDSWDEPLLLNEHAKTWLPVFPHTGEPHFCWGFSLSKNTVLSMNPSGTKQELGSVYIAALHSDQAKHMCVMVLRNRVI